jgi:hypothetical protein
MKAGPNFKQRANASIQTRFASGRLYYPRENFEQCRFAGAVTSDDSNHFAWLYVEVDVPQGPQQIISVGAMAVSAVERNFQLRDEGFTQSGRDSRRSADLVLLADVSGLNDRLHFDWSELIHQMILPTAEDPH